MLSLTDAEGTLIWFELQVMLPKVCGCLLKVLNVILLSFAFYHKVVNVAEMFLLT